LFRNGIKNQTQSVKIKPKFNFFNKLLISMKKTKCVKNWLITVSLFEALLEFKGISDAVDVWCAVSLPPPVTQVLACGRHPASDTAPHVVPPTCSTEVRMGKFFLTNRWILQCKEFLNLKQSTILNSYPDLSSPNKETNATHWT